MSEAQIQAEIVKYYTNTYCLRHHTRRCMIFSVPNGGTRHPLEAMALKSTGLLPGVSDLIVVHDNGVGGVVIFIEVKTNEGKLSKEQVEFQSRVASLGLAYCIVRSLEEFINVIRALPSL